MRNKEKNSILALFRIINYKDKGLSMRTIIAGWDKKGPQLITLKIMKKG
jgi:hypothetical protein